MVQLGNESEAAVVLTKSLLLVPDSLLDPAIKDRAEAQSDVTYQLAAMMGLCNNFLFDFAFCVTLEVDERFFFFCNSRPILSDLS